MRAEPLMTEHLNTPSERTPEHQFNRLLRERDGEGRILAVSHPTLTMLAHDQNRHLSLSVRIPEGVVAPGLRSTVGIRVGSQSLGNADATFLTFTSMSPSMDLVFLSFARFVVDRSAVAETDVQAFQQVSAAHAAFREYMEAERTLSKEKIRGLVAELLVLKTLIDSGRSPMESIMSWRGPFGESKDFILASNQAIEVKSASFNATSVRISSLEQLDPNNLELHLAVVRLEEVAEGTTDARTLKEHVDELRSIVATAGDDVQVFNSGLSAYGLSDLHADALATSFVSKAPELYTVSEGFPKLTPNDVPRGIIYGSYSIDFDAICDLQQNWSF